MCCLLASFYYLHVLYWEGQKWTWPPWAEQKDPLPQPAGKAFAGATQEAAGHLCHKDTLLAHINLVSTRSSSFFSAKLLPIWSECRISECLDLLLPRWRTSYLTPFGEYCVVPGHHFSSLPRPSEGQHNTLVYQPLLPALHHLQSKSQTQINMKWIEPKV